MADYGEVGSRDDSSAGSNIEGHRSNLPERFKNLSCFTGKKTPKNVDYRKVVKND